MPDIQSAEDRVKFVIGDQAVTLILLKVDLEKAQARIADLEHKLQAAPPKE